MTRSTAGAGALMVFFGGRAFPAGFAAGFAPRLAAVDFVPVDLVAALLRLMCFAAFLPLVFFAIFFLLIFWLLGAAISSPRNMFRQ
jgi:hypothetical protein